MLAESKLYVSERGKLAEDGIDFITAPRILKAILISFQTAFVLFGLWVCSYSYTHPSTYNPSLMKPEEHQNHYIVSVSH